MKLFNIFIIILFTFFAIDCLNEMSHARDRAYTGIILVSSVWIILDSVKALMYPKEKEI